MQIIRNIPGVLPEPCVATIGFFDGVHMGHRFLIEQVRELAAARGLRSLLYEVLICHLTPPPFKKVHLWRSNKSFGRETGAA